MIGQVVGNYRIVSELGRGGMGMVYRVEHTQLGRPAALKMLLPQFSADPGIVQRFFNEARAASAIEHPGIVEIFDFGTHTDGAAYIVMEMLRGESMQQRLARGTMAPIEAASICAQVAGGLAAAHARNIVHRDLKPDNIFLVPNELMPDGIQVKVLDFGIAKLADERSSFKTQTGALIGTPAYMSPEQCMGSPDLDHRTDLYALGCILFHALTGRPPFVSAQGSGMMIAAHIRDEPPHPRSLAPATPDDLAAIALRLLAKEPAARFQTALELRAALAAAGANVPGTNPGAQRASSAPPTGFADGYAATLAPTGPSPSRSGVAPAPTSPLPAEAYARTAATGAGAPLTTGAASAGQIVTAVPRPAKSKGVWIGAGIAVLGLAGAGAFVAVSRGGGSEDRSHVAAGSDGAGVVAGGSAGASGENVGGAGASGENVGGAGASGANAGGAGAGGAGAGGAGASGATASGATAGGASSAIAGGSGGAAAECPQGQERTPDTQGKCCWPQQAWSTAKARCIGVPSCPPGTTVNGESCVASTPAVATTTSRDITPPVEAAEVPRLSLGRKTYAPGTTVEIRFSQPVASPPTSRAWIAIASAGSAETQYHVWKYVPDRATSATLIAPRAAGAFEVRLHTDYPSKAYNVRARAAFKIEIEASADAVTVRAQQRFTLAAKVVAPGASVAVVFPGPMIAKPGERFWITIVERGASDSRYETWKYVAPGARRDELAAPTTPGAYELRLHANYPTASTNVVHRVAFRVE